MTSHLSLFNLPFPLTFSPLRGWLECLALIGGGCLALMSVIPQCVSSGLDAVSLSPGTLRWDIFIQSGRKGREGGREGARETQRGTEEKEGCCVLEGLPQQKDLSRVLYLPPPLGGHIRACVGWFVCCLFSFVCRNARATTGEHRGFCPNVI